MKKLKILMILIGVTVFSGCTSVKYRNIHSLLTLPHNCIFEKFTQEEKDYLKSASIGDKIGRKIYRNQNACKLRQERANTLVNAHNEAHKN